ncbi:uncharacterized protein LOC144604414 [Rhinoraja longicauda]
MPNQRGAFLEPNHRGRSIKAARDSLTDQRAGEQERARTATATQSDNRSRRKSTIMYPKVEWLVGIVLLSVAVRSKGAQKHCAEPSERKLSHKLDHWESDELGASAKHLVPGKKFNSSHSLTLRIGERSTSPWSYRVNEDKARYPRRLMEAYCLHKGCFGSDGKIDHRLLSVPHRTPVVVLRRSTTCRHNTFVYEKAVEDIPFYCVCVMATENKS